MNRKVDELNRLYGTSNLFFIKELSSQMQENNFLIGEISRRHSDFNKMRSELDSLIKRQNILLALIIKLAAEVDTNLNTAVVLLHDLERIE